MSSDCLVELKTNSFKNPTHAAQVTLDAVRNLVLGNAWTCAKDLFNVLTPTERCLFGAINENAPFARNLILRCLKIIRDDYTAIYDANKSLDTHTQKPSVGWDAQPSYAVPFEDLKERLLDSLSELSAEMELNALNMAQHAPQHVHTNDVVLTMGYSPHVELFLKTAAKKGRSYHVIVAEGGPEKLGRKMACSLASEGVAVTLISDAAVFAVMPKVNKVVLGTYLVMSNGGIRAMCGSHLVALAASRYAVPVLICSTSSALVPEYPEVFEESMMHKAPFHDFAPKALCVMKDGTRPAMCNPMYDYVPPDLISIFLFNSGGYVPSYVYSLRSELYSLEDISWIPGRSPDGEKLSQ